MHNRLAAAASAYLKSAAHQPIHWHSWGPEPFAEAARDNRPILLDIGAVWCHWCHVMDGESYEDPALAEYLNQHFTCIKVDRDERPDVDARYQRAVQAMTGQGGWPLTAFLLPDGQVFYGGTYFPPDGKYGRPGFRSVLQQVLTVFREQPDRVRDQALAIRRVLTEQLDEAAPGAVSEATLAEATERIAARFDFRHGGFGTQPKFPHPAVITFLLHRWRDTGDDGPRDMVERTLDGMARGGIHDQLGGGFHRYSVDARWVVPHFEKMSYDNAELLKAYLDGHAALGRARWADVARGIVRWVEEVLADPAGGYGASQDADVGLDDDGDYFTWTLDQVRAAIADEEALAVAAAYYDIGTAGEMQHDPSRNVLYQAEPLEGIARRLGVSVELAERRLALARERLRAARAARPVPHIDRTRYTNWNGMLAGAMIRAGVCLDLPGALEHGLKTLRRIRQEQADPAALSHRSGGPGGLLDDQVQVALAALEAYEATGDGIWLEWAMALMDRVWADYHDPEVGGLWDTAAGAGAEGLLPTRARPVQDTPTPSANGVAALVCARLGALTTEAGWLERHTALVRAFAGAAGELGIFGATFLQAADWLVHPPTHLVIVEAPGGAEVAEAMHLQALRSFVPRRVVQRVRLGATGNLPLPVAAMASSGTGTRGFACVGASCRAPVTTPEEWTEMLQKLLQ